MSGGFIASLVMLAALAAFAWYCGRQPHDDLPLWHEADRRNEGTCPKCGEKTLDRIEVDIGVGAQCGPWECYACGWGENDGIPSFTGIVNG